MLSFFPWLTIEKKIEIGEIILIPFERDKKLSIPEEKFDGIYKEILGHYLEVNDRPVEKSTLVFLKNKDPHQDYTHEEIEYLFSTSEIIAFSGLANRKYFDVMGIEYCNRIDFTFVIQKFNMKSGSVGISTRRRDGHKDILVSEIVFNVRMPYNVNNFYFKVDFNLAASLIKAQEELEYNKWPSYADAIFNFNRANTDEDSTSEHQEVVMIVGAFQRLLECNSTREDELAERFTKLFQPKVDLDLTYSNRIKGSKYENRGMSLREIWIRDFYQLRGDYAHGKVQSQKPLIWEQKEHLLLGSYVFPLLVKCRLNEEKYFNLIMEDQFDINVFEKLADEKLFQEKADGWPWNNIRGLEMLKEITG